MKACTKCGITSDNFAPRKERCGASNTICRACCNLKAQKYQRTKKGLIARIYSDQRSNSKHRGHVPPTYNLEELRDWCFSQKIFHELYDLWKESGYKTELVPSCDRTDDSKCYTLSRLKLMTWQENRAKSFRDIRSGKLVHGHKPQKPVVQLTLDGVIIETYVSASEASRITCVQDGHISSVCLGKRKTAGGFVWSFANESELLRHN